MPRDTPFPIATGTVELRDESDGSTYVWVNGVPSSSLNPDPTVLDFEYMRHMSAAVGAWEPPARMLALHVGAAACTFPRHLVHRWPDSGHIAVDIDATLPQLVRTWWDLPRAPQLRIREQDGFDAVATRRDASLDLIVRDAFAGDTTPAALTGADWWGHAARALRPGGLVLANVGTVPGQTTAANDVRAARTTFAQVVVMGEHAVLKGKRRGNLVIAATSGRIDTDALARYGASAPLPTGVSETWGA